jgi:hypothetical protein
VCRVASFTLQFEGGVQVKVEEGVSSQPARAERVPHSSLLAVHGWVCVYGVTGCTADSSRVDWWLCAFRCCSTVGDAASSDRQATSPLHVGVASQCVRASVGGSD